MYTTAYNYLVILPSLTCNYIYCGTRFIQPTGIVRYLWAPRSLLNTPIVPMYFITVDILPRMIRHCWYMCSIRQFYYYLKWSPSALPKFIYLGFHLKYSNKLYKVCEINPSGPCSPWSVVLHRRKYQSCCFLRFVCQANEQECQVSNHVKESPGSLNTMLPVLINERCQGLLKRCRWTPHFSVGCVITVWKAWQ